MRSLPFNTAASQCATSDLGMRPGSRYRSRPGQPPPRRACALSTKPRSDSLSDGNNGTRCYDQLFVRDRERLAWGAGGGNERPCSPARCRRFPDTTFPSGSPGLAHHRSISSSLRPRGPMKIPPVRARHCRHLFARSYRHIITRCGNLLLPIGRGQALLPDRPPLQQGPHHPHQVMGRRHQSDLFPLRIVAPHPLEVRPDRRRSPYRLPGRLGK